MSIKLGISRKRHVGSKVFHRMTVKDVSDSGNYHMVELFESCLLAKNR